MSQSGSLAGDAALGFLTAGLCIVLTLLFAAWLLDWKIGLFVGGGSLMAGLAPTSLPCNKNAWRYCLAGVIGIGLPVLFVYLQLIDFHEGLLPRDNFALLILFVGAAVSIAWVGRAMAVRNVSAVLRFVVCTLLLCPMIVIVPIVLIIVHCSAGDCF